MVGRHHTRSDRQLRYARRHELRQLYRIHPDAEAGEANLNDLAWFVRHGLQCHYHAGKKISGQGWGLWIAYDMSPMKRTLEDEVSAVFERACREQDLAVAEHLLRALEVIAQRDGDDARLERALLRLVRTLPKRRC